MKKQLIFRLVVMFVGSSNLFGQEIQQTNSSVSTLKKVKIAATRSSTDAVGYEKKAAARLSDALQQSKNIEDIITAQGHYSVNAAQNLEKSLKKSVAYSNDNVNDISCGMQLKGRGFDQLGMAVDVGQAVGKSSTKASSGSDKKKIIYLGSTQNIMLDEEDYEKRFLVIGSAFGSLCVSTAFDDCRREVPLAQTIFTTTFGFPGFSPSANDLPLPFTIGDIFLLSQLSAQELLYLDPINGPNNTTIFGNIPDQQYLALLAPAQLWLSAFEQEVGANISFIYRFDLGECKKFVGYVGVTVPVLCRTHEIDLDLVSGSIFDPSAYLPPCVLFTTSELLGLYEDFSLFEAVIQELRCPETCPPSCCTNNNTSVNTFFTDFSSIGDFFNRAVLAPKNLTLERKQQKIGFGDISFFGSLDFAPNFENLDALQFGVNLSVPVQKATAPLKVWPVTLSNYAVSLDIFSSVIIHGYRYINPTFYLTGSFSVSARQFLRAPRVLSSTVPFATRPTLVSTTGVLTPVFQNYFTLPFSQVDTLVNQFADTFIGVRKSTGPRVLVGFGNYFYLINDCKLRVGVFYDFTAKGADKYCLLDEGVGTYDLSSFACYTQLSNRVSWHGSYKFGSCGEVMVGSQHVVSGRNTIKKNQAFITFVGTF